MLSASTMSSSSSSAFSPGAGLLTPSSQFSHDSSRKGGNPLTELIDTEQSFMETLKMIDSQVAPIWMKQMTSAAPDFSELLKYIHDILKANKRFCQKLTRIASNPASMSELGDVLMQWVNDLEVPYANYCRSYIPNLNLRTDILRNSSIHNLLQELSTSANYEINLESLFNSPIQQLKYYKGLYSRLLDGTDSSRGDYKLLLNANKRINVIMAMAKNSNAAVITNNKSSPLNIQTNFQPSSSDLMTFERQIDCSRTVDHYGGAQINYQLRLSSNAQLVMRNSFGMMEHGSTVRVHVVLTNEQLIICRDLGANQFSLLYPAISINDVTMEADSLDREIIGEYNIKFSILGKKHILMRADTKEIRNTWIGIMDHEKVTITPKTLGSIVQKKLPAANVTATPSSSTKTNVRNTDIFTFYSENGGVSPLESSADEDEEEDFISHNPLLKSGSSSKINLPKSRDTIMDIYDNHLYDFDDDASDFPPVPTTTTTTATEKEEDLANIVPQTVKIMPHVPNVAQATQHHVQSELPAVPSPMVANKQQPNPHVQMQYIQPPTAQMATMSITPIPSTLNNSAPPSAASSSPLPPVLTNNNKMMTMNSNNDKPASPRNIEVQRAVIPEAMQAVTQKTDEYINDNHNKIQQQKQQQPMIPRTSSMRNPNLANSNQMASPRLQSQPQYQQQRPPMPQQRPPMPQQRPPMPQYQQQRPPPQMYQNQRPLLQQQVGYDGYDRPMPSPPPQQQQFRPMNNQQRPMMSPSLSSGTNAPRGMPSPRLQQPPGRFNAPSPSMGHLQPHNGPTAVEDLTSPPHSPNPYNPGNDIRKILYSNSQCDVFHWNNNTWYAADGQCLLQIRVTHSNRTCVAVQLQNTGQLYLNAWILPNTVIRQPSPTDVSISLFMGPKKENYLIHFAHPNDANVFADILGKMLTESNFQQQQQQMMPEAEIEEVEPVDNVNVPQKLKPVMQCKAKLFIKNETANWSTFGGVSLRISQQLPSMRMLIEMENDKTKLVSAVVKSGNVEKINSKRISFLLVDEVQKTSIVYMIHLREDQTGNKIYEYLRTKNAENGW